MEVFNPPKPPLAVLFLLGEILLIFCLIYSLWGEDLIGCTRPDDFPGETLLIVGEILLAGECLLGEFLTNSLLKGDSPLNLLGELCLLEKGEKTYLCKEDTLTWLYLWYY